MSSLSPANAVAASANDVAAAGGVVSDPSSAMPPTPRSLLSLPDEVLQEICEGLSTFELLRALVHPPPNKEWSRMWHALPSFDVDLERDVGHAAAVIEASGAGSSGGGGAELANVTAGVPLSADEVASNRNLHVAGLLSRKRSEYEQIIRLLARSARDLQSLSLANFGPALADELPLHAPKVASDVSSPSSSSSSSSAATPSVGASMPVPMLSFASVLRAHGSSLTSLSLTNCSLRRVELLGSDFPHLVSLDLSKNKEMLEPRIELPQLTSLNLSRTLTNDWELLKLLPCLPNLVVLRLVGCKNLRKIDGDDPAALFGRTGGACPFLKIVDLQSCTRLIDASVYGLARHCAHLEALFLSDCVGLRAPHVASRSLVTLSLRGCNRLTKSVRITCPALTELDVSNTNLRDVAIPALHVPSIRVLQLSNCDELTDPAFRIASAAAVEAELGPVFEQPQSSSAGGVGASSAAAASVVVPSVATPLQLYADLVVLDVSHLYSLRNAALFALLEMCPRVEVINMALCKDIRSSWDPPGVAPNMNANANAGAHFERNLSDGSASGPVGSRRDIFPDNLSNLRELNCRQCNLDDTNLSLLLSSSAGLSIESLVLWNAVKVTGTFLLHPEVGVLPNLTHLDLRQTPINDDTLVQMMSSGKLPSLTILDLRECASMVRARVSHQGLKVLSARRCINLQSLEVDAPALVSLDASLNFGLSLLDIASCVSLTSNHIDLSHSSIATTNIVRPVRQGSSGTSAPASPLVRGATSAVVPPDDLLASRPLGAFSGAAYREYRTQAHSFATASGSPSRRGAVGPTTGLAALSLSGGSGSPSRLNRALDLGSAAAGATDSSGASAAFDMLPLHSHMQRFQMLNSSNSGAVRRGSQGASNANAQAAAAASASAAAASSSTSDAKPSSSSSSTSSSSSSSGFHFIRSVDLCVSEARVHDLETKLAAEQERLATLQAQAQGQASAPAEAQQAHALQVKDASVTCYGLKKQLAVARAKLKKEQREAAAAAVAAAAAQGTNGASAVASKEAEDADATGAQA